ncbi:Putative competence-damage inducible protein [Acaryochloris thomasi RCC1774]|uniref:CinA-like protein n=1 Tax=Acaryochloris thomasi RCC1774 TaxID=1764569 RepID=A0A2W1JLH0_9CYAN|nr:competence/damage-inducible protein A [Acaryochloris thomasi]PZD74169.1 Putative competence-damage inducible protein [Acaryochloris thomasi RCC1774]
MSPNAEIICVGTELLLGEILNTNSQFLGQELARLGIPHYYQTVVGDNLVRLQQAIAIACQRSSLIIFTGGLGPTPDDLTTDAIATFFQAPLVERPEIIADIQQKFAHSPHALSANNRKQALLPQGADILPNETGSAPGLIWEPRPGLTLLIFPGVPSEMQDMWCKTVVPYLKKQGWGDAQIYSRVLRFFGIPESNLAEKVAPVFDLIDPTVAPYAIDGEARLRISTRAASEAEAAAIIAPIEQQIRQQCGVDCYGADADTLASVVGQRLLERQETIAVAESCTGGGIGQRLTAIPGSSGYFVGSLVAYANNIKVDLLGVKSKTLDEAGSVSAAVAEQMAEGVRSQFGSAWGLSTTGIAGPGGGTPEKPVGLVYVGLAGPQGPPQSWSYQINALPGRDWIRKISTSRALDVLRRQLL